jgi:uncharacterized repeat protein (TIGR03803 family)
MRMHAKNLFLLRLLIAGLGLVLAGRVTAQTFTTLHSFTRTVPLTGANSDGANPWAGLVLSGNTLYGTAFDGGTSDAGTVFAVNTDGTGFKTLASLTTVVQPTAQLVLSSNTLYGTTRQGFGSFGNGTVFKVKTDGSGFAILHSFAGGNGGSNPFAGLVLSGTTLYGTTLETNLYGTAPESGTVFKINTDGTGFTTLYSFTGASDGSGLEAGLVLSGDTLYGTASGGGGFGAGTVFAMNTNGAGFTMLHNFTGGSDGGAPAAGLILSGTTLYGTAGGGNSGRGTVFAVNTDGTGFTNLYSFTATSSSSGFYPYTNSDGAGPNGLMLSGTTLYGTADQGGSSGNGTVFKVNTDGTSFTTLYSFSEFSGSLNFSGTNSDGAGPSAALILSGNTLYGTAMGGGSSGNGTVFSLRLPPAPTLTIIPLAANVTLTWPSNAIGFALQSTTNLLSPAGWTSVSTQPVVVNGQNTVTNPISSTQQFYRLSQ